MSIPRPIHITLLILAFFSLSALTAQSQTSGLSISPSSASLEVGESGSFTARFNGQNVTNTANWSIDASDSVSASVVEMTAPGRFRARTEGSVSVRARHEGEEVRASITVSGGSTGFDFGSLFSVPSDNEPRVPVRQQYDVNLVSQEPVFSRVEIPGGFDSGIGYFPFVGIQWLPGGHFVVSGPANSNAGVTNHPRAASRVFESGGMYLIDERGRFLGVRDVVFDTSTRSNGCFENLGCTAGRHVHSLGSGRFVRDLEKDGSLGWHRSPIVYEATSSGFRLISRLFFNDLFGAGTGSDLTTFDNVAVSQNRILGTASRGDINNRRQTLELYDTNFNLLGQFSSPAATAQSGKQLLTIPPFAPLVGLGEYVIARTINSTGAITNALAVYRIPSSQGQPPQFIQSLTSGETNAGVASGWAFDTSNFNRVALIWKVPHFGVGAPPPTQKLIVYEPGQNGLVVVAEHAIAAPSGLELPGNFFAQASFAVSGDLFAYGACPNRQRGTQRQGCQLVVQNMRTGESLSVEPLPPAVFPETAAGTGSVQEAGAVAIAPSGRILVATNGGLDNGNLHLYQIGGGGTSDDGPPGVPGIPGDPLDVSGLDGIDDYFDIVRSYFNLLRALFVQ